MADVWEKDLAQKASLTTSDFIRVVGSDNVSYKQGMSTVASVINSAQPTGTHSGSIKQWALQHNGQAIIATNPNNTTDLPDISNKYGLAWTKSHVIGSNKWVNLYWSPTNASDIYICSNIGNADNWTAWEKLPTRTEIDMAKNRLPYLTSGTIYNAVKSGFSGGQLFGMFLTGADISDAPTATNYKCIYFGANGTNDITIFAWPNNSPIAGGIWCTRFNQANDASLPAWTKLPTRAEVPTMQGGTQVTITDTTNGFIDTGINSANYVILAAYSLVNGNQWVRISVVNNGGNYRAQVVNCVTNEIQKSGNARIYYWVMPR